MDLYALSKNALVVVRQQATGHQVTDSTVPVFSPGLGLQGNVSAVSVPSAPGAGSGLMFVATDGTLHTLTQDRSGGAWSAAPVHLPATEPLELTTWRTQISIVDAWAQPVRRASFDLAADAPTLVLVNGATAYVAPGRTLPVTRDVLGRVTVAVPATGLKPPTLTLSGADVDRPITVQPGAEVNAYLAGSAPLDALPPLSPAVLAAAPISSGPIDPTRTKTAYTLMSSAAGAVPGQDTRESRRARPRHGRSPAGTRSKLEAYGLEWSLSGFVDEVVHGIESGAAVVSDAVVSAVSTVAKWAVDITVTCGDFIDHVLTVTVNKLSDAVDIVQSVVTWVGGEIGKFVDWLKAQIFKVFTDTEALATTFEGWVTEGFSTYLPNLLKQDKKAADNFLTTFQSHVDAALTQAAKQFSGQTFADVGSPPHSARLRDAAAQTAPDTSSSTANWLLDKIMSDFSGASAELPTISAMDDLVKDLGTNLEVVAADFVGAAGKAWEAIVGAVEKPQDLPTVGISVLITAVKLLVDAFFALAKAVVDLVIDAMLVALQAFEAVFTASVADLPLVGGLFKLANLEPPSLGKLILMIVAFPTVLAYKALHGIDAAPFQGVKATRGGRTVGATVKEDLTFCAAGAIGVWSFCDAISTTLSLSEEPAAAAGGGPSNSLNFWGAVDAVMPFVVTVLSWPGRLEHTTDVPFTHAPDFSSATASFSNIAWLMGFPAGIWSAYLMTLPAEIGGKENPAYAAAEQIVLSETAFYGAATMLLSLIAGLAAIPDDDARWSAGQWAAAVLGPLPAIGSIALTTPVKASIGELAGPVQVANCLIIGSLGAAATAFS